MSLPDTVARFVAETSSFDRPVDQSARKATDFGRTTERAALTARKALLSAGEAADKAATAHDAAARAADRYEKGEIKAAEAARAATEASRALERASIAGREAQMAAADAADKAGDQYRQLARDAELAAAAQQLGALQAAGATRQYNDLLARTKAQHGDLSRTAVAGFKTMEETGSKTYQMLSTGSEQLAGVNKLLLVGIANGLANLPFLASAAAGAITLVLGGALAGVGIAAQASDKQVRKSFSNTKTHVLSELRQISTPWHDTLLHMADDGVVAFDSLAPALNRAYAEMAPATSRFVDEAAGSLDELQPAIDSIGHAWSRILDDLGPHLDEDMAAISDGIRGITDAAAENPEAVTELVHGVAELVKYTGEGIGFLVRYRSEFSTFMHVAAGPGPQGLIKLVGTIGELTGAFGGGSGKTQEFKSSLSATSVAAGNAGNSISKTFGQTRKLVTAQDAAKMSTDKLKSALDKLTGTNISFAQAQIDQARATKAASDAVDHHRKVSLDEKQSLVDLAKADQDLIVNMRQHGATANELGAKMNSLRSRFITLAQQMGYSRTAAKKMADQLLGVAGSANKIPSKKSTHVTAPGAGSAKSAAEAVGRAVRNIPQTWTVNIGASIGSALRPFFGGATGGLYDGKRFRYAAGGEISGLVTGPGTGTSDSIFAGPWLSNGEYVVRAEQTRKHFALIDAINRGADGFAGGGLIGGTIVGGPVTMSAAATAAGRLASARARPEALAAMAAQQSLAMLRGSPAGGITGVGAGPGGGMIVQHITNVNLSVGGSIRSDRDVVEMVQGALLNGRKSVTLPPGR